MGNTTVELHAARLGDERDLVVEGRLIEDGGAARVTPREGVVADLTRQALADVSWIGPDWIDLQINGLDGHDPNAADASAEVVSAMDRSLWRSGRCERPFRLSRDSFGPPPRLARLENPL
jgi:N-acetylglucosamine-6-phosphate deacetylase